MDSGILPEVEGHGLLAGLLSETLLRDQLWVLPEQTSPSQLTSAECNFQNHLVKLNQVIHNPEPFPVAGYSPVTQKDVNIENARIIKFSATVCGFSEVEVQPLLKLSLADAKVCADTLRPYLNEPRVLQHILMGYITAMSS